jgi:hypothetical protein
MVSFVVWVIAKEKRKNCPPTKKEKMIGGWI